MALHGVDISSYQSALNVGTAAIDFVVIKATEGTGYVNPSCDPHYQQAKSGGKLRGLYHFAANLANTAVDEAQYFVANCKGYIGDAILVLDYENSSYNHEGNVAWALAWLQEVERLTGVKPLIYMNANCVNTHDWSPVINNGNALWVAAYQASPPDVNWPNAQQAMWQYSSSGKLAGYAGSIDFNTFWGDATGWSNFAKTTPAADTQPVVTPVPAPQPEPVPSTNPSPTPVPVPPVTTTTTQTPPIPSVEPSPSSPSPVITSTTTIPLMSNKTQAESLWTELVLVGEKIVAFLKLFKRS